MKFAASLLTTALALAAVPARAQTAASQPPAKQMQPAVAKTHLKAGDKAPEFTLRDHNRKPVTLAEFRGKKNVILAFYVLAFTGG